MNLMTAVVAGDGRPVKQAHKRKISESDDDDDDDDDDDVDSEVRLTEWSSMSHSIRSMSSATTLTL